MFAVAVGDFGFRTYNPSPTSEYMVDGVMRPFQLQSRAEPKKHLYLRHKWRLTEPPERAWLQLVGHDLVEVFVNGRRAGRSATVGDGRLAGLVIDITSLLHGGENSVAIHVPQLTLHRPPQVAIEGECEFSDGGVKSLADPHDWRASDIYDHRGPFWYETAFDDSHWSKPAVAEPVYWRAQVKIPPRSITEPRRSRWITPPAVSGGVAAVAGTFDVPDGPRDGWLRIMSTGSYRVAVNGWLATTEEPTLSIHQRQAGEQTFDVSPLLRQGQNTISILAETPGEAPRVRADLEATTLRGERVYVATNDQWKGAGGYVADWIAPNLKSADWQPCKADLGYLGVMPRFVTRELIELKPPAAFWFARAARYAGWIVLSGLTAAVGASLCGWLITRTESASAAATALPYLALLPSTVAAATGSLMTWDLAYAAHDVYKPLWLMGVWLLVVAQWLLLIVINSGRAAVAALSAPISSRTRAERAAIAACWITLAALAFWLRWRDLTAEPIHHDEVTAYAFTMSIFEYGFPGGQVHPDIPFGYCATSELCYYFHALAALVFDDPLLVLRVPALLFSMATLALVAYIAWKWFNGYAAFVAGVFYALSPHIIGMAEFGRYLSQVQFFTLLTTYLTYEAVRGAGPPHTRLTWAAALSFVAMYLSWEGSGMFALGLAVAVLFHRRRHLKPLLASPHLYMATTVVALVIVGQNAHRIMQQTQRLWFGQGISSITIKAMWRYPFFQHDYFLINSSWIKDALLPMAALVGACFMAVRHRWRFPLRFALICMIGNAELMVALLPVRTNRYAYHLTAILILIAAAVVVAAADALLKGVQALQLPTAFRRYARTVVVGTVVAAVALMSGWTVRTAELTDYVSAGLDIRKLRIPDWDEPMDYLLKNMKEGDIVLSIMPHTTNYMFAVHEFGVGQALFTGDARTTDYWPQSRLILQATMGDETTVARDRRSGAVMLYNLEQVEKLFATHDRIWYLTLRGGQSALNDGVVSKYLREHLDVVSEDFATALMMRDKNNRPARVRLDEEEAGHLATDYYLR
jgi:hypothetical protein